MHRPRMAASASTGGAGNISQRRLIFLAEHLFVDQSLRQVSEGRFGVLVVLNSGRNRLGGCRVANEVKGRLIGLTALSLVVHVFERDLRWKPVQGESK